MRASETSPGCVKPFRERDCSTPTLQVSVARTGRAGSALSSGMTSEPRQEGSPVVELKLIVMRITNNVDYNRKPRLPSGGNRPPHVRSIVPSKTKRSALDLQVRVCCAVSTLNARATLGVELIPASRSRPPLDFATSTSSSNLDSEPAFAHSARELSTLRELLLPPTVGSSPPSAEGIHTTRWYLR